MVTQVTTMHLEDQMQKSEKMNKSKISVISVTKTVYFMLMSMLPCLVHFASDSMVTQVTTMHQWEQLPRRAKNEQIRDF